MSLKYEPSSELPNPHPYTRMAERGGELVGYVNGTVTTSASLTHDSMEKHEPEGTMLCIHSVVVPEQFRREKVATKMLKVRLNPGYR